MAVTLSFVHLNFCCLIEKITKGKKPPCELIGTNLWVDRFCGSTLKLPCKFSQADQHQRQLVGELGGGGGGARWGSTLRLFGHECPMSPKNSKLLPLHVQVQFCYPSYSVTCVLQMPKKKPALCKCDLA